VWALLLSGRVQLRACASYRVSVLAIEFHMGGRMRRAWMCLVIFV
jgi:hypothetical protein